MTDKRKKYTEQFERRMKSPPTAQDTISRVDDDLPPVRTPVQARNIEQVTNQGLSIQPDGTIRVGSYIFTGNGLELDQETEPNEADWAQAGEILFMLEGKIQLLIGDWLVHGETTWGKTYRELAERFNRDEKTLRNYRWVAQGVELSLRKDNLSFGHYNLVAGLTAKREKRKLLDQASKHNWTVAELRAAIKGDSKKTSEKTFSIKLGEEVNSIKSTVARLERGKPVDQKTRNSVRKHIQTLRGFLEQVEAQLDEMDASEKK